MRLDNVYLFSISGKTALNLQKTKNMETEKIISTLKEKVGTTTLSDKSISDYVGKNLLPEGTEPDDAYFNKHADILKSFTGNFNHDVAARVEEFKKNYKPESHVDPKPDERIKTQIETPPSGDKKYEELLKKQEEMEKRWNEKEKAEQQAFYKKNLADSFKTAIESKNLLYDPIYYKAIESELGEIDTKKDLTTLIGEITPKYEKMLTDNNRNGGIPSLGGVGGGDTGGKKAVDNFFEQKAAEEGWAKK